MRKHWKALILAALMAFSATACAQTPAEQTAPAAQAAAETADILTELGLNKEEKDATEYTAQINSAVYSLLDFEDTA